MTTLLTILHVVVCLFLMLTVLLQSGKSGGMGAAFGGGNAATVFGGSGASSFLRRLTAGAATVFMFASMTLAFIASHNSGDALEKFGAAQQDIATQKEKEKERALGSGAGVGSGSAASGMTVRPPTATMGVQDVNDNNSAGSAAPTNGDTPILGSGFSPGTATHPTPAPNSTGAANPPAKDVTPTKLTPAATPTHAPVAAPTPAPAAPTATPAPTTPAPAPAPAPAPMTTTGSAAK